MRISLVIHDACVYLSNILYISVSFTHSLNYTTIIVFFMHHVALLVPIRLASPFILQKKSHLTFSFPRRKKVYVLFKLITKKMFTVNQLSFVDCA